MRKIFFSAVGAMVLCAAVVSCSDDDFTVSSSAWLELGVDTVSFDTVFCSVPSASKDFWVFNRGKEGIRLTSVAQQRGNQSGFRVNVDGIYLGQNVGYQTTEVEIRGGDSVRVFVELTANPNGAVLPQLMEDNLVFTLESGNVQQVNLRAYAWDATILTDPEIKENTTYTGEKPILIYGMLRVDSLATLTLAAGTTLYLRDEACIDVYGTLLALGEKGNEVVLRGSRLDNMFDYLPYDHVSGQWQGVHFYESSYGNRMEFTDLHSAFTGITIDSASLDRSKLEMYACTVHNCQGYCINSKSANIELRNCQITNALADCMSVDGGSVVANNCTFAQFYPFDSARGVAFRFSAGAAPMTIRCDNSLITGYADDELQLTDTICALDYHFDDCIIRLIEDASVHPQFFLDTRFETAEDSVANGQEHFVEVDLNEQRYDFHLVADSPCIDSANALTAEPYDRDGLPRDERPDVGAYEFMKQEDNDETD